MANIATCPPKTPICAFAWVLGGLIPYPYPPSPISPSPSPPSNQIIHFRPRKHGWIIGAEGKAPSRPFALHSSIPFIRIHHSPPQFTFHSPTSQSVKRRIGSSKIFPLWPFYLFWELLPICAFPLRFFIFLQGISPFSCHQKRSIDVATGQSIECASWIFCSFELQASILPNSLKFQFLLPNKTSEILNPGRIYSKSGAESPKNLLPPPPILCIPPPHFSHVIPKPISSSNPPNCPHSPPNDQPNMQKTTTKFFCLFAFFLFQLPLAPICAQHSSIDEHFLRHSLLNKFLYQLHDHKGNSESEQSSIGGPASFLFPLQRTAAQIRPPLTGLPPSLAPSNGLLLPTPAQLPPIFRLPATAMAQNKAFPMDGPLLLNPSNPPPLPILTLPEGEKGNGTGKEEQGRNVEEKSGEAAKKKEMVKSTEKEEEGTSSPQTTKSTSAPSQGIIQIPTAANLSSSIDLESFLRTKNVSSEQRAEFMRILEAEVTRRLESHLSGNKSKKGEEKTILTLEEVRRAGKLEQELVDGEQGEEAETGSGGGGGGRTRVELKTADTRLFSLASGEANEQERRTPQAEQPSSDKIGREDYRQREQAEFDRLLGELREEGKGGSGGRGQAGEEGDELLLVVQNQQNGPTNLQPIWAAASNNSTTKNVESLTTPSAIAPQNEGRKQQQEGEQLQEKEQQMSLNRQHRFWTRQGPKNKFERLVEDYRFRLSGQNGQNGLNDLIKALRNSHIGFFDRNANPNSIKILRRIDR